MKIVWNDRSVRWFRNASEFTGYNKELARLLLRHISGRKSLCDLGCGAGFVDISIIVNGQSIDLDDLPIPPYREGTTVMVPLRKIGEALGYKVDWNSETIAITIDDEYIQKATLFNGTTTVIFEGRLQVINMSREIENEVPTAIHDGYTYVPLEFFKEFFNDTVIDGTNITITPSKSELRTNIGR